MLAGNIYRALLLVTWSPGHLVTWSPGHLVWSGLVVTWSGLVVTWSSPGLVVTWSSPGRHLVGASLVTWLLVTWSGRHLVGAGQSVRCM
jgi:hypothetical protein